MQISRPGGSHAHPEKALRWSEVGHPASALEVYIWQSCDDTTCPEQNTKQEQRGRAGDSRSSHETGSKETEPVTQGQFRNREGEGPL